MGKIVAQTTQKTRPETALNFAIEEELYVRLRVHAAQHRMTLKALATIAIERFLANPESAPAKSPAA